MAPHLEHDVPRVGHRLQPPVVARLRLSDPAPDGEDVAEGPLPRQAEEQPERRAVAEMVGHDHRQPASRRQVEYFPVGLQREAGRLLQVDVLPGQEGPPGVVEELPHLTVDDHPLHEVVGQDVLGAREPADAGEGRIGPPARQHPGVGLERAGHLHVPRLPALDGPQLPCQVGVHRPQDAQSNRHRLLLLTPRPRSPRRCPRAPASLSWQLKLQHAQQRVWGAGAWSQQAGQEGCGSHEREAGAGGGLGSVEREAGAGGGAWRRQQRQPAGVCGRRARCGGAGHPGGLRGAGRGRRRGPGRDVERGAGDRVLGHGLPPGGRGVLPPDPAVPPGESAGANHRRAGGRQGRQLQHPHPRRQRWHAPHAAEVNQPNTWAFAGKDVYAPLNDYIKRDRATSQAMADFYPGQIEAVTWRGQTYFFPAGVSMEVWHANKTFWQRAGVDLPRDGWTWTDLANTIGPKLQSAVGPDGSALMLELNEMYRMLAFIKQNGGDMLDKSGTRLTIAEPPSVEAFEFVRGLVARGIVVEQNKEKKNFRLDDLRVALELEGMTRIPVYRKAVGADQAWVPGPKKKVRANIYDSWVVGLVRNADAAQDGGGLPVAVLADPAGAEPGLPEGAGQSPAPPGGGAAAGRGRPVGHRAPDPRGDGRPELRHHLPLHARHRPHPGRPQPGGAAGHPARRPAGVADPRSRRRRRWRRSMGRSSSSAPLTADQAPAPPADLVTRCYLGIRDGILRRRFLPGERLAPADLAREFGVSRTPVHFALKRLALEGLVVIEPRRGTVVRRVSTRDVAEVAEVRTLIEVHAAAVAAQRVTPADLATPSGASSRAWTRSSKRRRTRRRSSRTGRRPTPACTATWSSSPATRRCCGSTTG